MKMKIQYAFLTVKTIILKLRQKDREMGERWKMKMKGGFGDERIHGKKNYRGRELIFRTAN